MSRDYNITLSALTDETDRTKLKKINELDPESIIESVCDEEHIPTAAHIPKKGLSEVECSCILFPKSPSNRQFSCSKPSRIKPHQRHSPSPIRKTKSTAIAATQQVCNNWQTRGETVSTPDLPDNARQNDDVDHKNCMKCRKQRLRLSRAAICFDNLRWINVFLNIVILVLSFLYLGSAVAFTFHRSTFLLVLKVRVFVFLVVSFYIISFTFWVITFSGLYYLWKISRRIKFHAVFTFVAGILMVLMLYFQNSAQTHSEAVIESQLLSAITFTAEHYRKDGWDHVHSMFKCCGVNNFLDWCQRSDLDTENNASKTLLLPGTYVCSIPTSCCSLGSEAAQPESYEDSTCSELSKLERIAKSGCIHFITRELHHLGKMYKMITGGSALTLIIMAAVTMFLLMFLI